MNELIEKFYDEMYSPKITPELILKNINLPNYTDIKFEKNEHYIIVITSCKLENGEEARYRYSFTRPFHKFS